MKKVSIQAPDSLNEITLEQYQKFKEIEEPTEKDVLSVFLGLSPQIVSRMPLKEAKRVTGVILDLLAQDEPQLQDRFVMNGIEYGFIPNLDDMTFGEHLDLTESISDWDTMHVAMSVLYRPVERSKGKKYYIQEYKGTRHIEDQMKRMPLGVVMGSLVFFYHLAKDLLKAIPNSIQKQLKRGAKPATDSLKHTEAITSYIQSLKQTTRALDGLLEYPYMKDLYSLHTKKADQNMKYAK